MIKISKQKILPITILLTLLLVMSAITILISKAEAVESTSQQKGLAILNNVVGVDLAKYGATVAKQPSDVYLGVLPQENLQYTLQSNESTLNIAYTFVNGNLQMIHVLEGKGLPITTKSATAPIEIAKDFLSSYQNYSGNPFYGEIKTMLNNIDASKSLTTTVGNTKLDVTALDSSTTFRWTYVYDGVEAPVKCVALDFENGFLKYFIDNWNLYSIGSTSINLSEKESTDNGLSQAKNYSWRMGEGNNTYQFNDFNATQAMLWETIFSNGLSAETARNHDPLTLYPMRHVWVSLDKFYPGNVYGIEVFLWADTKEVYNIQERSTTVDPPADLVANLNDTVTPPSNSDGSTNPTETGSLQTTWITTPTLTAVTLGAIVAFAKKKTLSKSRSLKTGVLLCLITSLILMFPISYAFAVDRCSLVWGSRSSGANDPTVPGSPTWRKTAAELGNQSETAAAINYAFSYYGNYSGAHNYQGEGSKKSAILGNITYSNNNYPFVAVVDFDHGVGNERYGYYHYMFEDDVGCRVGPHYEWDYANDNGVYDYEIFSDTGGYSYSSNVYFAFISTCMSADLTTYGQYQQSDGSPVGMPYAWTHRIVNWMGFENWTAASQMSMFGYEDGEHGSDNGDYCYIGFPYGSAALAETSIQSGFTQTTYASWVQEFFAYALMYDYSVKDALDEASQALFTMDFDETALYTGFQAIWPMYLYNESISDYEWQDQIGNDSTLAVYGNGNLHLRAPELTVNAFDSNGTPISANVYIDSQYAGTTGNTFRVSIPAYHTVQVVSGSYTFQNFTGCADFENPISAYVHFDTTVTANFYSNPPPQYKLTVSSGSGGSTSLSSGDHYYTPQKVAVTAYPDNDYVFDYWLLDSVPHSENPICVSMSGDHILQANFRLANPHWVTITAYNQYSYPGNLLPVYVDYELAGYTDYNGACSVLVSEGYHFIEIAYYVDDQYDNFCHFDSPQWTTHTLWYLDLGGSYWYGEAYLEVTSDLYGEAWYHSDG